MSGMGEATLTDAYSDDELAGGGTERPGMGMGATGKVRARAASWRGGGLRRPRADRGDAPGLPVGESGGDGDDGLIGGVPPSSGSEGGSRSEPPVLSSRLMRDRVDESRADSDLRRLPLPLDEPAEFMLASSLDDAPPTPDNDSRLPLALTDPCPCSASARSIFASVCVRCDDGG